MARSLPHTVLRILVPRRGLLYAGRLICAALFGVAAAHVTLGNPAALFMLIAAVAVTAILIGVEL